MIVIFSAEYELIATKKKAEGWIVECEILKLSLKEWYTLTLLGTKKYRRWMMIT